MLKALSEEGILWLTRVYQVAWKLGKTARDWQIGVIIPIFKKEITIKVRKKGDHKQCTNYRGISLLSLPGEVYAKCLETKCREIMESKLVRLLLGSQQHRPDLHSEANLREMFGE